MVSPLWYIGPHTRDSDRQGARDRELSTITAGPHVTRRATHHSATFARVREAAASLDGLSDATMYGAPALKLRGHLVACMATHSSAEPGTLVVRMDIEQRDALIRDDPSTYYLTDHYVGYPSVLVRLSRASSAALKDLLATGWRYIDAAHPRHARVLRRIARN